MSIAHSVYSHDYLLIIVLKGSLSPLIYVYRDKLLAQAAYLEWTTYRANVDIVYLAQIIQIESKVD